MSERPVILFMFAGRRANLEINLPQFMRIVEENPRVQFHIWDLARNPEDSRYIQQIPNSDRVTVCTRFSGPQAPRSLNKVWQFYSSPRFSEALFVKVDDDMVFVQTERFAEFVDAIENHTGHIMSAEVINNGACTEFVPALWDGFLGLDIPLLDVHESNAYAEMCHEHMFDHWQKLVTRPTGLAEIQTWLSINFIGMDWERLCRITHKIGRVSPEWIADRQWRMGSRMGDEGAANLFPRMVMTGFTTAHLGFGPQKITAEQEEAWQFHYASIGERYLAGLGPVQKLNTAGGSR